ncbi:MAG: hypothetical protein PHY45_10980 [Rhodocyclaceae bacterium]|nr:hypothetical protein [Rhodocyclaceae bacterium]
MRAVIPIKQMETQEYGKGADGWERLSTLSEPRLSEMAENYKTLGYEVEVRDIQRTEGSCNTCFDAGSEMGQVFGTLFIRRGAGTRQDEELFD